MAKAKTPPHKVVGHCEVLSVNSVGCGKKF